MTIKNFLLATGLAPETWREEAEREHRRVDRMIQRIQFGNMLKVEPIRLAKSEVCHMVLPVKWE